jgi:deoxyribodipyrimidine photo-lyase
MEPTMNLYLFQNDLRIHDQPLLNKAMNHGAVIGLFVFEDDWFKENPFGFQKKSNHWLSFVYDTLLDLNKQLSQLNVPLIVKKGNFKEIIKTLVSEYSFQSIYFEKLPGDEEKKRYDYISTLNIPTYHDEMKPLYKTHMLPFLVHDLPFIFTQFRHQIERLSVDFKECKPLVSQSKTNIESHIPSLDDLNIFQITHDIKPGETEGLKHLSQYLFKDQFAKTYKDTRNGMLNFNDSTKFSAYLSIGALSVNRIMNEVKKFELNYVKNDSTYWIYFELLWRDYFYFVHLKYGNLIFNQAGLTQYHHTTQNPHYIKAWKEGKTGYPLIDANMRQLVQTGYMSNRGRQNVANFFTKFLNQDWRIGAAFFESYLIDYDVSSNTLNWLYNAGLGNDPRENRMFNYITQGERYDKNCLFLDAFLPELKGVPTHLKYRISELSELERVSYGIQNYPKPIKKGIKS